jgi:TfoX/Sxy family transcriptional regulator of competence genes
MSDMSAFLFGLLEEAAAPLPGVAHKRMFGCDALFAEGNIFGMIWKEDRIGLKFPNKDLYGQLMALEGSAPWTVGEKVMGGWVLAPEAFHDDNAQLTKWVRLAHSQALAAGPKVPKVKKAKK